jgi:hypothetical protein
MLISTLPLFVVLAFTLADGQKPLVLEFAEPITQDTLNVEYEPLDYFEYRLCTQSEPGKRQSCSHHTYEFDDSNSDDRTICGDWGDGGNWEGGLGRRLTCTFYTETGCRGSSTTIKRGERPGDNKLYGVRSVQCFREDWKGPWPTKAAFIRFGNENTGNCLYYDSEIPLYGVFGLAPCPDPKDVGARAKFGWAFMVDGTITTLKNAFGKSDRLLSNSDGEPQMEIRRPENDKDYHQKFVFEDGSLKQVSQGREFDGYLTATMLGNSKSTRPPGGVTQYRDLVFLQPGVTWSGWSGGKEKTIRVTKEMQNSWFLQII